MSEPRSNMIDFKAARARLRPESKPFHGPPPTPMAVGAATDVLAVEGDAVVYLTVMAGTNCVYQLAVEPAEAIRFAGRLETKARKVMERMGR